MRKKIQFRILMGLFITLLIWGFFSMSEKVIVRYWGNKVQAVVVAVPEICDRYNNIDVIVGEQSYTMAISRKSCREKMYRIGQKVQLYQLDGYQNLEWKESQPLFGIFLVLLAIALGIWSILNQKALRARFK